MYPDEYGNLTFTEFMHVSIDDDKIQTIIDQMDLDDIIGNDFVIRAEFNKNQSLSDFHKDIETCLSCQTSLKNYLKHLIEAANMSASIRLSIYQTLDKYTDEESACKYKWGFWFDQLNIKENYFSNNKDMSMTGLYKNKTFIEYIYSPRNINPVDPFYVDIMITNGTATYYKRYHDNVEGEIPRSDSKESLPKLDFSFNPRI